MSHSFATALVTGASSGLGREFCRQLAPHCERIVAVARRSEELEALAAELDATTVVRALVADLATVEGVTRVVEAIRQQGPVDILVNNAGFAAAGGFGESSLERQLAMVAVHLETSLSLCRAVIPFMRARGRGAIINVSSLAGFLVTENAAVYAASKAFLNSFTLSLREELAGAGIRVQALCPGFTRTGFHATDDMAGFEPEKVPDALWMSAAEVVTTSLAALDEGRALVVPGDDNRARARAGLKDLLEMLEE